jgi:cellulose synthase/poly-beta-1,6-N-acetylglucosamine synthase-like glycosyltransferase
VLVILLIVLIAFYLAYALAAAYLSRGIHNSYQMRSDTPLASVVIPARNEEHCLSELLDSLLEVDYPADKLEIIVVNDQSTDGTREVASSYQARFRCRYEVCDVVDEPDGKLILKTRPLAQGLDRAHGEIVLMTDADCVVPKLWVRAVASYFTEGVGMVCGTTIPNPNHHAVYPLTWFETVDWLFLLGASAALSGQGEPQALIGNNYAVLLKAYREIGTFRSLAFSDLDDIAMMQAVKRTKKWSVVFPADSGVQVFTRPLPSLGELVKQRRRWMKGLAQVDWLGKGVLGFGIATHVLLPVWPFLLGWWSLLPLGLLMAGDGFVLARMLQHHRRGTLWPAVPFYPLFAAVYGIGMVTLLLFKRRVKWKERKF